METNFVLFISYHVLFNFITSIIQSQVTDTVVATKASAHMYSIETRQGRETDTSEAS